MARAEAAVLNLGTPPLDERSKHLRRLAVRTLAGGERGHVGSSMSLVEIMRVLYDDILRYRPQEPKWRERDRMILSKGHGCIALYVMLAEKGFIPIETLDTFCRRDSILGGHPEAAKVPGVEASTGALGHGLSVGVGMALAARIEKRDSRVIVVMGDGEINEGSVWEAALCAGKHKLANLTAVIDYNKIQSAGPNSRNPGSRAAARQMARVQFRCGRCRRPRRQCAAQRLQAVAAGCRQAERRHLPYREGQGYRVRRARSQLAPQVEDR